MSDLSSIDDIQLDSIDIMGLAAAVARFFCVYETGREDTLLRSRRVGDWVSFLCEVLAGDNPAIAFTTSGTTGRPATVRHSIVSLSQEVEYLASLFGDAKRVVTAVEPKHIYGFLFGALLPETLNCVRVVPERRSFAFWRSKLESGDTVVTFPDHLRFLGDTADSVPDNVTIVTSTAPCPRSYIDRVLECGVSRVVEIYGATETGGIGSREDDESCFSLFPYLERAFDGSLPDENRIVRTLQDGSSVVLAPMDNIEWRSDRCLIPVGRIDAAVQVGGTNVYPGHVEKILLEHERIVECAVRYDERSARLKAFIVPDTRIDERRQTQIREWIAGRLPAPEQPKTIQFGESIPVNALGKRTNWE